ncbi:MAG TPA: response regulator transcription factor [Burkholderiales bacterium]
MRMSNFPTPTVRILIIEDEGSIATNLCDYLESHGHTVDAAFDGVTGLHLAVTQDFDAIVLDLNLPGIDGVTLCRRLREDAQRDTPVLMLTARDTLEDKLEGFDSGADDYLAKPFALAEVEARLQALHKRRVGRAAPTALQHGAIVFDPVTLSVTVNGKSVRLPPKPLRLLELMLTQPARVYTRADLEQAVWGDRLPSSETLRSHMYVLRRAFQAAGAADPIENMHGVGYRLASADRG